MRSDHVGIYGIKLTHSATTGGGHDAILGQATGGSQGSRLDDQGAKLAAFQRRYIGELPEDDKTNLTLLMGMSPQLEVASQALNQARQDKVFTESLLSQQLAALDSSKETKNPQTLEQQLRSLRNQLQSLEGHYTEHHPDVVKLKDDIAELQKKLEDASAHVQMTRMNRGSG